MQFSIIKSSDDGRKLHRVAQQTHTAQSRIEPMPRSSAAVDLEALRWTYAFRLVTGSKVKLASLTLSEVT
jgi:hypothetical protein